MYFFFYDSILEVSLIFSELNSFLAHKNYSVLILWKI